MQKSARPLAIVIATSDGDRADCAFAIAAAQAALGGTVTLYFHGVAARLLDDPVMHPLFEQATAFGIRLVACQSGIGDASLSVAALPFEVEAGGLVSLLAALGDDRFIVV